jgi:hypothetical protein
VSEAELREHRSSRNEPEVFDQVLAQHAHGYRINEQRPLPGELNHSARWIELEELGVI